VVLFFNVGERGLSHFQAQWGSAGTLCTLGGRPPGSFKVADCYSVEDLGFQLLDGESGLSCKQVRWEVLGLCVLLGSRLFGAVYRVVGYSFLPLSGKSGILAL
jgi:hypothetical protein